jgi:cellulose synthase/poly-beta-1,6-N-acetylglucosamine synthase-like glycosyltransferase
VTLIKIAFWLSAGLLVYTHIGYPLLLWALTSWRRAPEELEEPVPLPKVSLIVAAHDEEMTIVSWLRSILDLDYPRDRLEIVVVSDGSADRTLESAAETGADVFFEVPRGGKVAALNAAVERSHGEVVAFSDANARWAPDALRRLVTRLSERDVGYVCGQVRFDGGEGGNEEGLYWRYEMAVREMESRLGGVTAGNGGINAVRRDAYLFLEPKRGQDISFPFELTKRGWRAEYEPKAQATEQLADTIGDEFGRKRRMMTGAWNAILATRLLLPFGYSPIYALQIYSHRLLRYTTPVLHLILFAANLALLGEGAIYVVTLALQLAVLAAAALAGIWPGRLLRIARYYVAVTAASAAGLWDLLRRGVPTTWEKAEGTR